ncbi:MAG: PKD domain-containing protein [Bacteroidales bacterium]|jgi:hypothetical protein|nr:PKD domain-containing protein [Bacteroidales bacterium]
MKKLIALTVFFLLLGAWFTWQGCKQSDNDDDPNPPGDEWTTEDQQTQDQIVSLQDEASEVFEEYLLTMDTASAIAELAQWFQTDPEVEWAVANSQGVAVEYKSGILSGIFIDPLDEPLGDPDLDMSIGRITEDDNPESVMKVMPNHKKVLLYNAHYFERKQYTDAIISDYNANLPRVGMSLAPGDIYLDEKANIDVLKNLSGYGYIHFYSHGLAWPDDMNLSEVYLMTGEPININTNAKYKQDVKAKKIIFLKFHKTGRHHYFVSPQYVMEHNDLSQDTVLFFGGFCYGFLGSWKQITEKTAAGAWVGADWSVLTDWNSSWARGMVYWLTKKPADVALSVNDWYTGTPDIPKNYTYDNRVVTIKLHGRGDIAFWKKVTASIQPTASGGAPVVNPGHINEPYTFRANTTGAQSDDLKFTWNFGDGTPEQDVLQIDEVSHTWTTAGNFTLTVDITDIATQELLDSDTADVVILPDQDILAILHGIKHVEFQLNSGEGNHYFNDGSVCWDSDFYVSSNDLDASGGHITWDGPNFTASGSYFYDNKDITISGTVSADGNTLQYLKATRWYHDNQYHTNDSLVVELSNLPLSSVVPAYPLVKYEVQGPTSQNYITSLFFMKEKEWQSYLYYTHSDWENVWVTVNFIVAR